MSHDPAGAGSCPQCLWGGTWHTAAPQPRAALPSHADVHTLLCSFGGALMKGRCRGRFVGMFILRCFPPWVPTKGGEAEDGLLRRGVSPRLHPSPGTPQGHSEQGILQTLPSSLHSIWGWPHLATAHAGLATWFHLSQAE